MIAILWALIGGARGIFVAAGVAAAVWSSMLVYDRLVDDPAVAAAARADYVKRAELVAAQSELAEVRRQLTAGTAALDEYRKQAKLDAIADEETARRTEAEIAAYEKALIEAGRSCKITVGDLDFFKHR